MSLASRALSALALSLLVAAGCSVVDRHLTHGSGGAGAGGGSGGAGGTGGGGPPVPCSMPRDCPGGDTQCATRTCEGGFCSHTFTAKGTAVDAQAVGDCHKIVCDGHGNLDIQVDDTDIPDDDNPCTKDLCDNGTPSNPPAATGASCGGALKCDGNGHCTGCTSPGECPGMDNDCEQRSCTNSTCGYVYQPAGTVVSMQTAGDCKKNVCNGMGAVSVVFDNTDAPDTGNDCVNDSCIMGSPAQNPKASGAACAQAGGNYCDGAGNCVECVAPTTCPGADSDCTQRTCAGGACGFSYAAAGTKVALQVSGDCRSQVCDGQGNVVSQPDNSDVPAGTNPCVTPACSGGQISGVPAPSGTDCGAPHYCDGQGNCIGCASPAECPGKDTQCQVRTCTSGVCGMSFTPNGTPVTSQTAGDCLQNVCNGMGSVISVPSDSDVPGDGNACTSDVCSNGTPSNPPAPAGTTCGTAGVCNGAGACGVCAPGDVRACCGVKTSACCFLRDPGCDPDVATCPPDGPKFIGHGPDIVCCCGSSQDCDSTGQWGPCY